MIRVLFDTNIFISAILFGGLPGQLLARALAGPLQLVTSPILLDELDEKLSGKFRGSEANVSEARLRLERLCDVVSTTASLKIVVEDPEDDRVLECALAGRAEYIVTGDRHLLQLREFRGIPIVTARQFVDILNPPA